MLGRELGSSCAVSKWQHEECRRSDAERSAKQTCTEAADQRHDHDRGKERNILNARNVGIDGEPERRGNPSRYESEGVGSDGSRPQRRDIDVKSN
jgi:hypothetical protein